MAKKNAKLEAEIAELHKRLAEAKERNVLRAANEKLRKKRSALQAQLESMARDSVPQKQKPKPAVGTATPSKAKAVAAPPSKANVIAKPRSSPSIGAILFAMDEEQTAIGSKGSPDSFDCLFCGETGAPMAKIRLRQGSKDAYEDRVVPLCGACKKLAQ